MGPAFPLSRVQHISDLHSKFALGPHCSNLWPHIQSATAEIRREKKIDRKKIEENTGNKNIMAIPLLWAAIKNIIK